MEKKILSKLVKPTINKIAKYIPGDSKIIGEKKVIKLSSNESPFKVPKNILSFSSKLIKSINTYPDGDCLLLKTSISEKFRIKKNQIICGNGSDDILSIIAQAFGRENSEIICSQYGFVYYPIISKVSGSKVVTAKSNGMNISLENILRKISKKTKIIFFANPNNPTGTVIFKNELVNFLKKVPKNIIVVIDGAYSEFITESKYTDGINLVNKFPNIIVTRTFSKIFALAGLRLGWGYSSKNIIDILEKIRGPFNVNLYSQALGALILNEKNFIKKSIQHNDKWQKKLHDHINKIGLEAYKTYANFILVKVNKSKFNKPKILSELNKNKILVRDLKNNGLDDFFRVSIGTDKEMIFFLKKLSDIMKNEFKKI
jgi:histidinol-phosphate aminotransferase